MLQHCQVAGPDQCREEATAVGEQRGSLTPGIVHREEGEAVVASALSSLLTEKRIGPSDHLQGSTIEPLCKWPHQCGSPWAFSIRGTKLLTDSWPVPVQPLWKAVLEQCRLIGSIFTQWIAGLAGKISHIPDKMKISDTLSQMQPSSRPWETHLL